MRLVGLISGGKDSIYNMLQCIAAGHEIVAVANIEPESKEEIDSYMFQSVGHEAISLISTSLGLPIFRHKTKGQAFCKNKVYVRTTQDEVEDLFEVLSEVKKNKNVDGVSVGAIASDYQRTRVENVCSRLNLICFAYLWKRDQTELLEEMIKAQIDAVIIKVACIGLNPQTHLGMRISEIQPHLVELERKFGVNVCGEGGEYETLTLDCPLYNRLIEITESDVTVLSNDAFAPVGFLHVKKATLHPKHSPSKDPLNDHINNLKLIQSMIRKPYDYIQECLEKTSEMVSRTKTKSKLVQEVPFPFDAEESDSPETAGNSLYDRGKDVYSSKSLSNFQSKINSSFLLIHDSVKCQVSSSSGWCFVGNITGLTITDALNSLQKVLESHKYECQDAVFVNLYIKNMADFTKINKVYSQYMPSTLPPARACVESDLPSDINIIISVVAHKIVSKSQKLLSSTSLSDRDGIHVRSISHWAPANIGPYSQCIQIGRIYYLAGQIPLVPGAMEILDRPIFNQCKLTLRHVQRVLEASDGTLNFSNVLQAICYVTSESNASDAISFWSLLTNATQCTVASVVVSALPKNAELEWEVLACKSNNPEVAEKTEKTEDFVFHMKRCVFRDVFASSIVCKFSFMKKAAKKGSKTCTPQGLGDALSTCIQFLKADCKIGSIVCNMKLFHKTTESSIKNLVTSLSDCKVVYTTIPVFELEHPELFLMLTGVCH